MGSSCLLTVDFSLDGMSAVIFEIFLTTLSSLRFCFLQQFLALNGKKTLTWTPHNSSLSGICYSQCSWKVWES